MDRYALLSRLPAVLLAGGLGLALAPAHADVTVQQQLDFNFAFIKAHSNVTQLTSGEKRRSDSDLQCEGAFMSLLCGKGNQDQQIVRLDKGVQWRLDPKQQQYLETPIENLGAQRRAALERMKQCKAPAQQQSGPDTSDCDMSPPQFEAKQTGQHSVFAGHDAQLSSLRMTMSCRNRKTGDTCDFVFSLDSWLTQEHIDGIEDIRALDAAYARKLGLDGTDADTQQTLQRFLAPYRDALQQMNLKAADFKGYPLKTDIRIAFGGAQCAAAKNAAGSGAGGTSGGVVADAGAAAADSARSDAANQAGYAAGSTAANAAGGGVAGSVLGNAAGAFGQKLASGLAGGLFKKKSPPADAAPATATQTAPASGLVQVAQISVETRAISTGAIAPDRFEIPAGYRLNVPKPRPVKADGCAD